MKAKAIIEKNMASRNEKSSRYKEIHKEDIEQMAAIHFNLYLSSMQSGNREKCQEFNAKCLEYNIALNDGKDTSI